MATLAHIKTDNELLQSPILNAEERCVSIVVAEWNSKITKALLDGAIATLREYQVKAIRVTQVPGTFELTYACSAEAAREEVDAVIAIGCVIRGDTPHFDYICEGVTHGLTQLNVSSPGRRHVPVIFGVLTTNTEEQAEERAGGALGNKGAEAAITALKMCAPYCYSPN
ncbi:MAG: 6,7-dimethyl-8-ribityllumazine synthase [Porphyromonas sp.]|nr:6,7-dimethyl-8-ribityllumazine synthase [Porphyromonas sp.]